MVSFVRIWMPIDFGRYKMLFDTWPAHRWISKFLSTCLAIVSIVWVSREERSRRWGAMVIWMVPGHLCIESPKFRRLSGVCFNGFSVPKTCRQSKLPGSLDQNCSRRSNTAGYNSLGFLLVLEPFVPQNKSWVSTENGDEIRMPHSWHPAIERYVSSLTLSDGFGLPIWSWSTSWRRINQT